LRSTVKKPIITSKLLETLIETATSISINTNSTNHIQVDTTTKNNTLNGTITTEEIFETSTPISTISDSTVLLNVSFSSFIFTFLVSLFFI
jgi:hypothetical protein